MWKWLLGLGVVAFFAGAVGATWLWWDMRHDLEQPMAIGETPLSYEVKPGMTMNVIARDLAARGILKNAYYLPFEARRLGTATQIKIGEYLISPQATPLEFMDMLVAGRVVQHAQTFIEGWTFLQFLEALERHNTVEHTLAGLAPKDIMAKLGAPGRHPEGLFFPDTYYFTRGTTDLEILTRAYKAMEEALATAWESRAENLPYANAYEALIMASIIEKETGLASERPLIGGVFVRRLQRGMRLQTDPTVIYGIGPNFDGNIRRMDLEADTPYNTYQHRGLPPTPIAMPGRASIEAALHPSPGSALYFVAKGDGSHQFSGSLEEHNRAVRQYQLKGN